MNKVDPFFTLVLILISGLAVTYKAAQYDLSGLKFQMLVNEQLKHQIKVLKLKHKELELTQNVKKENLNLSQIESSQKRNVSSLSEVAVELDPDKQAQQIYESAVKVCLDNKKNFQCLEKIDSVISQFPASVWAGESMVLLTHFYQKNRKIEEARELIKIVKIEFGQYPIILTKLSELEKRQL